MQTGQADENRPVSKRSLESDYEENAPDPQLNNSNDHDNVQSSPDAPGNDNLNHSEDPGSGETPPAPSSQREIQPAPPSEEAGDTGEEGLKQAREGLPQPAFIFYITFIAQNSKEGVPLDLHLMRGTMEDAMKWAKENLPQSVITTLIIQCPPNFQTDKPFKVCYFKGLYKPKA